MGRKSVLTKKQIINCAFNLCSEEGISNITIRNIAKMLNTSTAPIYTQYSNRAMILEDLDDYIGEKLYVSMMLPRTDNPFFNIELGIIQFVLNNRRIVNEFYFTSNRLFFDFGKYTSIFVEQMKNDRYLSMLSDESLERLLEDMRIYTYGFVATICLEPSYETGIDYYYKRLEEIGAILINNHLSQVGKDEKNLHVEAHRAMKERRDK